MSESAKEPEVLKVVASENINTADVPPGGAPPPAAQTQKTPEEIRKYIMERQVELLQRYVSPHNKKSREVTEADIARVISEGEIMLALCGIPRGYYSDIIALAHPQIEDKDPLRFYVRPTGELIINPVITSHTKVPVFKDYEGCMSYPDEPMKKMVPRFNKVDVRYQTILKGEDGTMKLSEPMTAYLNGATAWEAQHECAHLNGHNLYDKDFTPEHSTWYGEGESKTV